MKSINEIEREREENNKIKGVMYFQTVYRRNLMLFLMSF